MSKKEVYQYCLWSLNKEVINEVMIELDKMGIPSRREVRLGNHLLLVNKKNYNKVLNYARANFNPKNIGAIDYYRHRCGLNNRSLVYGIVSDAKNLKSSFGIKSMQPKFIKDMLTSLSELCGIPIDINVNTNDIAIEFYTTEDKNLEEVRDKIIAYLYENMGVMFERIYKCEDNGRLIKKDKNRKRDSLYNLFDTSFISAGMHNPRGANVVSYTDEDNLYVSGYKSSHSKTGYQHEKQNIVMRSPNRYVINGNAELYEIKDYHYTWDAKNERQNNILPVESTLIDNITYNATIVVDDNVAKITTNYKDSRETKVSRNLAFNLPFPSEVSVRNGLLPFPLKTGDFSGIIEEYYIKSTDGTKLLHYVISSPLFEVYDIPSDFDFVNNNKALVSVPEVYDIREFNPEDPNVSSVTSLIDDNVRKLMLTDKVS